MRESFLLSTGLLLREELNSTRHSNRLSLWGVAPTLLNGLFDFYLVLVLDVLDVWRSVSAWTAWTIYSDFNSVRMCSYILKLIPLELGRRG
jgi:hypothetical protein